MKKTETQEPDDAPELTPEQLAELKSQAAKADEHKDSWLRTAPTSTISRSAPRANVLRPPIRQRRAAPKTHPILEQLRDGADRRADRAGTPDGIASLQSGIAMIQTQLKSALAESGLEKSRAGGKPFDRRCTKPFPSRNPPTFRRATSSSSCAKLQAPRPPAPPRHRHRRQGFRGEFKMKNAKLKSPRPILFRPFAFLIFNF